MYDFRRYLNEGGWMSTTTQSTVITPSVVKKSVEKLTTLIELFNEWLNRNGDAGGLKLGSPMGSTAYHNVDPEDKIYGDIDIQVIVPNEDITHSALEQKWNKLSKQFFKTEPIPFVNSEESSGGHPIIEYEPGKFVQVDFMWAQEQNSKWAQYRGTPERGLKGLLYGNLFSVLGDMLKSSIQYVGVQHKSVDGEWVEFTKQKGTKLNTISTNPESFLIDIFEYLCMQYGDQTTIPTKQLAENPGVDTNYPNAKRLVKGIVGLAKSIEKAGLFGHTNLKYTDHYDFIRHFMHRYEEKAQADIDNPKRDAAQTPEAKARAASDREKVRDGLEKVKQLFKDALASN